MTNALLLALALAGPARAEGWEPSLPKALAAAKQSGKSVLADFTAPWCRCGSGMEPAAAILDDKQLVRLLAHLGLPTDFPRLAPARSPPMPAAYPGA